MYGLDKWVVVTFGNCLACSRGSNLQLISSWLAAANDNRIPVVHVVVLIILNLHQYSDDTGCIFGKFPENSNLWGVPEHHK